MTATVLGTRGNAECFIEAVRGTRRENTHKHPHEPPQNSPNEKKILDGGKMGKMRGIWGGMGESGEMVEKV